MRVDFTGLFRALAGWAGETEISDRQTGETLLAMMRALVRFDDIVIFAYRDKARPIDGTMEAGGMVRLGNGSALASGRTDLAPGAVTVALRPEAIRLSRNAGATTLEGTVTPSAVGTKKPSSSASRVCE